MDINSLVSKYLENHTEVDRSKIGDALENLRFLAGENRSRESIFSFDDENTAVSKTDFVNIMCDVTGKSPEEIQEDVSILFDILNYEEDGNDTLSKEEMSIFNDSKANGISTFRIWDKLFGYDEEEIDKYLNDESDSSSTDSTSDSSSTDATTSTPSTDSSQTPTDTTEGTGQESDSSDASENELTQASISDRIAKIEANKLYNAMERLGTDESTVSAVLKESNYTPADIVKIMKAYESQYGKSLMKDIQEDYSGAAETDLRNLLYKSAEIIAYNALGWNSPDDIPEDIVLKTSELYNSLSSFNYASGMQKFNSLNKNEMAQVIIAYEMLYGDDNAMDTITQGKHYYGAEDTYVNNIINSLLSLCP